MAYLYNKFFWKLLGISIIPLILAACGGAMLDTSALDTSALDTSALDTSPATANQAAVENVLPPAPTKGHPAPEFRLATLGGEEISLSELRGKPVIVNFWASWCGPCRLEMPDLQAMHVEQGDVLTVLGVNLTERDSDLDSVAGFIEEFGVTFPVVLDTEGEVADLYRVRGQPASVFIDADGVIFTVFYGVVNEQFIQDRINELVRL